MLLGRSSCGKDSLMKRVVNAGLACSLIYHTTRPMREGEVNGDTYFFGDDEDFAKAIKLDTMLEYRKYVVRGSV